MNDLIEALQIFLKYGNPEFPTHCEHDELSIHVVAPEDVSAEDIATLDGLGFFVDDDHFSSFRFGSC